MTASSVIRVDFNRALDWAGATDGDHAELTGEAVVADLGERNLVALLEEGAGKVIWLTMDRKKQGCG
ncbi:hypothetical protein [Ruegeria hyattellae]|uniref:hypothetical protein n=1 Tax=Ruegeria hyattellae TaxID=3233337 RepID=UPI00355C8226